MTFGRCVAVIDLGTHTNMKFLNDKGKHPRSHMVQIQWELPNQMMEYEGQQRPMMATKRYTLSCHEKAVLRQHLESWYGQKFETKLLEAKGGFDVEKLLGRPALVNIAHSKDGKYANIVSLTPLMKGQEAPPQIGQNRFFTLTNPKQDVWDTLSQKTRDFIRQSEEVLLGGVVLPLDPSKKQAEPPSLDHQDIAGEMSQGWAATDEDVPF